MALIATDRHILIVGLGKTGLSCVRFLRGQGHEVVVADSRLQPPGLETLQSEFPDVALHCGPFNVDLFCQFNELIVSPGVAVSEPAIVAARQAGARIRGDIDLFREAAKAPIVAITGSNGKSTVTMLVGEMARAAGKRVAVGGNLGTPALELLADDIELYVMELSSFQLETTERLDAEVATVLNISDDHMDRYAGREEYFKAKQRIYNGCRTAVINLDDPLSSPLVRTDMTLRGFAMHSINPGIYSTREDDGVVWITRGLENLVRADTLKLRGTHNLMNVMAALALGEAVGLPLDVMVRTAQSFTGLRHRCQPVRTLDGVEYINDSKGTNVGASVAAINSLAGERGKIVLIAGGDGKGADFTPLSAPVERHCRGVILFGRDAPRLAEVLAGVPVERVDSLEAAVKAAATMAVPGDTVLLSPACASLDMFRHYEERGERFISAVEAL